MASDTKTKTILVFNAELQRETSHTIDIDGNGDVLLTCTQTGRFLKFPNGTTAKQLKEHIARHKAANEGQVTQASIDVKKEAMLKELVDEG